MKLAKFYFLITIGILGLILVIQGTGATTVDRYLIPPQILIGVAVLYFCALLTAIGVTSRTGLIRPLQNLRRMVIQKIGEKERGKLLNMVLILTFLLIAFSMTRGSTPMYRLIATNYIFSVLINVLVSVIASVGLFCWLSSLLISKQMKEKS